MNIFNKKKPTAYDSSYDNDFYRGPEDEADVIDEDDNDLIPPVPAPQ